MGMFCNSSRAEEGICNRCTPARTYSLDAQRYASYTRRSLAEGAWWPQLVRELVAKLSIIVHLFQIGKETPISRAKNVALNVARSRPHHRPCTHSRQRHLPARLLLTSHTLRPLCGRTMSAEQSDVADVPSSSSSHLCSAMSAKAKSTSLQRNLPLDILRVLFEESTYLSLLADVGRSSQVAYNLALVCSAARGWIEPLLYRKVVLSTAEQVLLFLTTLDCDSGLAKAQNVRELWFLSNDDRPQFLDTLNRCPHITRLVCGKNVPSSHSIRILRAKHRYTSLFSATFISPRNATHFPVVWAKRLHLVNPDIDLIKDIIHPEKKNSTLSGITRLCLEWTAFPNRYDIDCIADLVELAFADDLPSLQSLWVKIPRPTGVINDSVMERLQSFETELNRGPRSLYLETDLEFLIRRDGNLTTPINEMDLVRAAIGSTNKHWDAIHDFIQKRARL